MSEIKIKDVKTKILDENEDFSDQVRNRLKDQNVFLVNLMASPGSGKTTTLVRTIEALKDKYKIGVMEADMDSDVDSQTIAKTGEKVIQLHTGTSCHMDASMTDMGLDEMDLDQLDLIFLENVGNLVCPAEFDVGANVRVMILSVPEGDDKPLKYPLMFEVSDCLLINKIDAMEVFDFDMNKLDERVKKLNKNMEIYPISALDGQGFENWLSWLEKKVEENKR